MADTKKLAERLAAQRTELRQANEQLFATRARLEHLFASSATVVFSTRLKPDLAVTFVSNNITSLLGYDMAQLGDPSSLMQRVHPQDLPLFRQQRRRVLTDGAAAAEYRIRHADGHYRWIHEQLRLNRDEAGEPLEVVGSWVEVSERKRAEQALEESEATLRAIVDHAAEAIITIYRELVPKPGRHRAMFYRRNRKECCDFIARRSC